MQVNLFITLFNQKHSYQLDGKQITGSNAAYSSHSWKIFLVCQCSRAGRTNAIVGPDYCGGSIRSDDEFCAVSLKSLLNNMSLRQGRILVSASDPDSLTVVY